MAVYTYKCPKCSGKVTVDFSDSIIDKRLVWYASHWCDCGNSTIEEDDFGALPEKLRSLLLRQEGVWAVRSLTSMKSNVIALKVIRQALNLTLSEVQELLHERSDILMTGTRAEANLLLILLQEISFDAEVIQED
jgi:hypothetical protein